EGNQSPQLRLPMSPRTDIHDAHREDLRRRGHDADLGYREEGGGVTTSRHALRIEPVEDLEKARPLVQDDGPGQPRLEPIEHELSEQLLITMERHSPFAVVVVEHERTGALRGPAAPDDRGRRGFGVCLCWAFPRGHVRGK